MGATALASCGGSATHNAASVADAGVGAHVTCSRVLESPAGRAAAAYNREAILLRASGEEPPVTVTRAFRVPRTHCTGHVVVAERTVPGSGATFRVSSGGGVVSTGSITRNQSAGSSRN